MPGGTLAWVASWSRGVWAREGSVVAEWRPEQRRSVLFEDGCDDGAVGCAVSGIWTQLFVEAVPAAGRVHDDDLGGRVGQVQEGVWNLGRQVREAAFIEFEGLLAILTLKRPFRTWIVSSRCGGGPAGARRAGRLRP